LGVFVKKIKIIIIDDNEMVVINGKTSTGGLIE